MPKSKCFESNSLPPSQDFLPSAKWPVLQLRADLLRRTREFFHARGFLEVETPLLSHDVVVDRHLDPVRVTLPDDPRKPDVGRTLWLQTSPEFGMKRLMVAGAEAIYQITRAFRGGEIGELHNPEFTMVEWYRRGDGYEQGMQLLSDLAEQLLGRGAARRITYAELFERSIGLNPLTASLTDLCKHAPEVADTTDRDLLLDDLFSKFCCSSREPLIVYDFPASQSALARVRPGNPPVAERFELFAGGLELANGYHELLDPAVLRERNESANRQRIADGKPPLPVESRLLVAMEHGLPACSGCALGFDRLVMVAAGAVRIQDVMAFPMDRA